MVVCAISWLSGHVTLAFILPQKVHIEDTSYPLSPVSSDVHPIGQSSGVIKHVIIVMYHCGLTPSVSSQLTVSDYKNWTFNFVES